MFSHGTNESVIVKIYMLWPKQFAGQFTKWHFGLLPQHVYKILHGNADKYLQHLKVLMEEL